MGHAFRVVGLITVGGEKQHLEVIVTPELDKGIGWALTYGVRYFSELADEGTEHHGVWCYYA